MLAIAVSLVGIALLSSPAAADDHVPPVNDSITVDGVEYRADVMPGFDPSSGVQIAGSPIQTRATAA